MSKTVRFEVPDAQRGKRLDQVLAACIESLSRRQARVLLDIGGVFVDGKRVKVAGRRMWPGQRIEAHLGGALERATKSVGRQARERDAAALPSLELVHCDAQLVVVHKPAGLLSAPTPESDRGNAVSELLAHPAVGAPVFVVHRLDLQTSGLLVFARTEEANRALAERFRVHDIERRYVALVAGQLDAVELAVTAPVAGREARTILTTRRRWPTFSELDAELHTGRTHQIRLHCLGLGHPVLADPQYGSRAPIEPPRMALHARTLGFVHSTSGEMLRFEAEWPADIGEWLAGQPSGEHDGIQ